MAFSTMSATSCEVSEFRPIRRLEIILHTHTDRESTYCQALLYEQRLQKLHGQNYCGGLNCYNGLNGNNDHNGCDGFNSCNSFLGNLDLHEGPVWKEVSFVILDSLVIIAVVNMVIMAAMAITTVMATLAVMDIMV